MATIHLTATTTSTPEQFIAGLTGRQIVGKAFATTVKAIEARNAATSEPGS